MSEEGEGPCHSVRPTRWTVRTGAICVESVQAYDTSFDYDGSERIRHS